MMPYETLRQAEAITTAPLPPAVKKTALRRLYESALAQDARSVLSHPTGQTVVNAVRGAGAGAGIGLLLGWIAGSRAKGLDTPIGPIDAYAAVAGLAGSLIPNNPVAQECHNAMIASTAILMYRKTEAKKRAETGIGPTAPHGEDDPMDHIVQIAKRMGLSGP
jgi:hypothetical protein